MVDAGDPGEIRRLVDAMKAGEAVWSFDTGAWTNAPAIAIGELRAEAERLRTWIDTEGRDCPSNATIDAFLGGA